VNRSVAAAALVAFFVGAAAAGPGCLGCRSRGHSPAGGDGSPSPSVSLPGTSGSAPERLRHLLHAENTRNASAILEQDLSSASAPVRRVAVRALARIADPDSVEKMLGALADSDAEVLAWAAFGLGRTCAVAARDQTVRALAVRAVSLAAEPSPAVAPLDPFFSLARALGECATPEAERTLVSGLDDPKPRAVSASFGLGDIATRKKRLEEESAAALLRAAAGDAAHDPLAEAFFPFGRLPRPPVRAAEAQFDLARARLDHSEPARLFVVRALGKIGEPAVDSLARVLAPDSGFSAAERAEAGRALAAIPSAFAQRALLQVLGSLAPAADPVALSALVGPGFGTLLAVLDALDPGLRPIENPTLHTLASLPVSPQAPASLTRRIVALRCSAAKYVAGADFNDARLLHCDPSDAGVATALARLTVIQRGKLAGPRLAAWRSYLDPKLAPRVREAALQQMGAHPEIPDAHELLAEALNSADLGVVTTAAEQISRYPDRAFVQTAADKDRRKKNKAASESPAAAVSDPLVKALMSALDRSMPPDAIETISELAKAAGALRIDAARKRIEQLCVSPNPTLRLGAQTALSSMDGKKISCEARGQASYPPAPELDHLLTDPIQLRIESEAGQLTIVLDPTLAPVAATRIADLARKGFYERIAVHRVVAGFVVQFGDPQGDGYGGAGADPIRCEVSPLHFGQGVVGMALGGADTGASQIFVTLAEAPHLDGHYAVIGRADGPWDSVAEGDVIQHVRVVP
jgi:cyclophilin family peptidyl-prolyl cis-trans isomerase/HEAT repeat protein